MDFEVIEKNDIPDPKALVTERELMYEALKGLPSGNAMKIKCISWVDLKEKQSMIGPLSTRLRKEEGYRLATQRYEVQLSEKRRSAYERCKNKGGFKRECYLYVWKEKYE